MKKSLKCFAALALVLSFGAVSFAQPFSGAPSISDEDRAARQAEVDREPVPRGEKMGLLVVFHGSPAPSWKALTDKIVDNVRKVNEKENKFFAVAGANMEFTFHGDIVDGVAELEKAGCDQLVVVPAFIFPTSHVQYDVVAALGIYGTPSTREGMREEGMRTVRTKLPIAMGGTLSEGALLKEYVLDQVKATSKDPKNERVLIVAHGDEGYAGMVDCLIKPAVDAVAELGFDKTETGFIEMGQSFTKRALPKLQQNTKDGKKTLVVAVYVASSADRFITRLGKTKDGVNLLEGIDWVGNETPLGEYKGTAEHIYQLGVEASLY